MVAHIGFAALIFVAALNRNTAIFLVALYVVSAWRALPRRVVVGGALAFVGAFVAGTAITYAAQGAGVSRYTVPFIWNANTRLIGGYGVVQLITLFGVLAPLAVIGYRRAPPFLRCLAPVLVVYAGAIFVFGAWRETRLWMPILPVIVAYALAAYANKPTD